MRNRLPLLLLLLAYLATGTLYAVYTPAWQAPDEPAHYNYIRQLAAGRLPVIEPNDYDEAYRAEIVSARFAAPYSIEPLTYEDWQPPLYYLLQTPVYLLTGGSLLALRLFSLLLGVGIVVAAFGVARLLWPQRLWMAYTAAAFVAFLPQHVALLASVNNDSLAELLIGLLLWLLLLLASADHPFSERKGWLASGILLGLGFLTKATAYIMAPLLLLALWWRYRDNLPRLWRMGLLAFIPAGLLGSLWWLRNLVVYGGLDLLGKQAHDAVVVGQLRTAEWIATVGSLSALQSFIRTSFQSFWGQFGWMGVLMDRRIYLLLLLFSLFVMGGLLWRLLAKGQRRRLQRLPLLLLGTLLLLNLLLYLGYNVTFVQHQGRYLFPALIPIALAVAAGIGTWFDAVRRSLPLPPWLVPAGLALALTGLDLMALFWFIVPQLTL